MSGCLSEETKRDSTLVDLYKGYLRTVCLSQREGIT